MDSLFQRTSSFAPHEHHPVERSRHSETLRVEAKPEGPSRSDLERWYHALLDLLDRESDGDVDHTTELEDLRDEIYAYLH